MAVVVRDGGKPPERKWQLFTNFYLVIKKREANRNLPDRRLATLLREGDRLLKALHNRLGFELHSQAETSRGAQASLQRTALHSLVSATVSELQEARIAETIDVLMEATTERLVLVSTPKSGSEVRFDIRPLQEFFAAEYIYEGVEAERLDSRLRTILGDAHWREVVHFLLSALVENARQTELAVAVTALSDINERSENPDVRVIHRRLALGAIVTARLLQEGVLEQDRRLRQQFREFLEPLLASTDPTVLRLLREVHREHSRTWLIDVLVDHLLERDESESIGAAFVLSCILADDHKRQSAVASRIASASLRFQGCLFQMLKSSVYYQEVEAAPSLPRWVVATAFRALANSEWPNLEKEGVRAAFSILSSEAKYIPALAQEIDLSALAGNVLKSIIEIIPVPEYLESRQPTKIKTLYPFTMGIIPLTHVPSSC